jgi:MFS transporter, ACS family, D-galactonate transporter
MRRARDASFRAWHDEIIQAVRLAVTPIRLFALAVAGQFLLGIVLALPGTLFGVPGWTSALGFDISAQARLLVIFFAGQFAFTALAGSLVDRIGCQRVLSLGSLLIATAFVLLAGVSVASGAMFPVILLAAGGASINAASNTLVSVTYGARRGAMLSVMATFGASGALVAPVLFGGGLGVDGVAVRLWALALFARAVTALPLLVQAAHGRPSGPSLFGAFRLLRERPLIGLIALLGLDFGDEAVLAGWTAAFTIAVFPGASGGLMVGLYWGGLCLGRVCAPLVLARAAKLVVVLVASTAAGLAITAMAVAPSTSALAAAVFVAGLAVGPLGPTIVSVAGDRYPRQMGAAIGLLLAIAQIGGMALPWLTGRATIAYGYRTGLVVPALAAFGLAVGTALAWQARVRRVAVAAAAPAR